MKGGCDLAMLHDFIVIGAGVAGLSAAARLSELGRVLVLEAEEAPGYHASGRSAALFEEHYGSPTTIALNRASRRWLEEAHGGVLSPRGFLLVGGRGEEALFEADLRKLQMEEITLGEARALVPLLDPGAVSRAAYHADAHDIDTHQLMQNYLREMRANGGELRCAERVCAIRRHEGRWQVQTESAKHEARLVFNAGGAWADTLAEMAGIAPIGLTAFRRSIAVVPAPEGVDVNAWPMILGANESWYAKPDAGRLLVSPAEEEPLAPQDAWPEDLTLAEGIARFEAHVRHKVRRLVSSWAGLRTFAPDRALVIGEEPQAPGFWWIAGQGGFGMQSSPAAGRLLADLVAGRQPELDAATVAALSPARFGRG